MNWITRKDIKVDRVACPWLIRRFILSVVQPFDQVHSSLQ